jgi:hypothetical protein
VRSVLLQDWDPIGVRSIPQAQDEYDDYVPGVCALVAAGASPKEVADHLRMIETDMMGRKPEQADMRRILPVAEKLRTLVGPRPVSGAGEQ